MMAVTGVAANSITYTLSKHTPSEARRFADGEAGEPLTE